MMTRIRITSRSFLVAALFVGQTTCLGLALSQGGWILPSAIVGVTGLLVLVLTNQYAAGLAKANLRLEKQVAKRSKSLIRTRNAVVFGLAKLAESRDSDTGEHLERIRSYVTILARELAPTHPEIDQQFLSDLAVASSLHDIGKVGVPDSVLLKSGDLTAAERHIMQQHTTLGSECLAAIRNQLEEDDFLEMAQQIALAHHEHWDGNGYPHGIRGSEIPLAARIIALADCYDALTTNRPYKGPVRHDEVREWIATRYGTQFDPAVVEAFIGREQDFLRVNQHHTQQDQQTTPDRPAVHRPAAETCALLATS
jgi:response regulator RpfG family c-di-GMP phosphodiesterase